MTGSVLYFGGRKWGNDIIPTSTGSGKSIQANRKAFNSLISVTLWSSDLFTQICPTACHSAPQYFCLSPHSSIINGFFIYQAHRKSHIHLHCCAEIQPKVLSPLIRQIDGHFGLSGFPELPAEVDGKSCRLEFKGKYCGEKFSQLYH